MEGTGSDSALLGGATSTPSGRGGVASLLAPSTMLMPAAGRGEASRARFDRRVIVVALTLFSVLMAFSARYGFHRDELYFLDSARHLQASYVDQPVFTPLIARLSLALFGLSLVGLHLWAALAGFGTVILGGLLARELGGGQRAQLMAAIGVATMPALLAADHLTGPTAFDVLAWSGLALIAVRIGRTGDPRWWLAGGAVVGLGLTNKHSIAFLALALIIGTVLSGGWRLMCNRWFVAGAVLASVFTIPDLVWQAGHGWATVTMTRNLNVENGGAGRIANFVVGQVIMASLALVPVWATGVRFLWRSGRPAWKGLAWAYALLLVFFALTTGSKIYYLLGAYVYLLAAGAVALEGWLAVGHRLRKLLAATALTTVAAVPLVLPVLPADDIGWTYGVNQALAESVGWPGFVGTVAAAWHGLPAATRARSVLIAQNYGEAGAINELGHSSGLPVVFGDQNSGWWWMPAGMRPDAVVAIAPGPGDVTGFRGYLLGFFSSVRTLATVANDAGLHNQEWGGHIYLCTGLRHSWPSVWQALRHYG